MPGLKIDSAKLNPMNDEAFAIFTFKGIQFEIHTPLSDYWIDKPESCPEVIFDEIAEYLDQYRVRWWHHIF